MDSYEVTEQPSAKYSWNKADLLKIAKVFGYSMGSATIGFVVMVIPLMHVPTAYAIVVAAIIPTINTLLVAIKKWFDGKIVL